MDVQDQLFCEIALSLGLLDTDQLERCRQVLRRSAKQRALADVTLELGMLGSGDLEAIRKQQAHLLDGRPGAPSPSRPLADTALVGAPRAGAASEPTVDETSSILHAPSSRPSEIDVRAPTQHAMQAPASTPAGGVQPAELVPRTRNKLPRERFAVQMPRRAAVAQRPVALQALQDEAAVPMPYLLKALKLALQEQASDLHLHPNAPLRVRRGRELHAFQGDLALSGEAIEKILAQVLSDEEWDALGRHGDVETEIHIASVARGRLHAYRTRAGLAAVVRVIPPEPPTLDALNLPEAFEATLHQSAGLIVVAGERRGGKTTTMAALARAWVALGRPVHIVENVIEFRFDRIGGRIAHRVVGRHAETTAAALDTATKTGSVILLSDLADSEATCLALNAVEGGSLVVGGLEAMSATDAIHRLVYAVPAADRDDAKQRIAQHLAALLVLRRLPTVSDTWTLAAELLLPTAAVRNAIKTEASHQLGTIVRSGSAHGMRALDDSLAQLLNAGIITVETARHCAHSKKRFDRSA